VTSAPVRLNIVELPVHPDSVVETVKEGISSSPAEEFKNFANAEKECVRITVYHSWAQVEERIPGWERIVNASPASSIFSTPEWLGSWWKAFGSQKQMIALAFSNAKGELVGLAAFYLDDFQSPLFGKLKCLRFVGDGSGDSDNLDLIVDREHENACAAGLIEWLKVRSDWDLCQLNTLPRDSAATNTLLQLLKARGWTCTTRERPRLTIDLPETWDRYLMSLSQKERTKVRYYSRRLERVYDVRFFKCTSIESLPDSLEALFALHQKRWRMRSELGSFASAARRNFYYLVARSSLKKNRLELWILRLNGKPVAAQFGFRYRDTVYSLQEGFDPDYATYKVGYVLRSHILRELISERVRRYDFLAGQDSSKERWGTHNEEYFDLHFGKPWTRGAAHLTALVQAQALKEWMRKHLPSCAWNILHRLNLRLATQQSISSELRPVL